jgi:shikimate 5-dehydrogenase
MDVVYNPFYTKLLRDAAAMGAEIVSGAEMFIHQGALQLKLWTGREAPLELMRKTIYERLASGEKRNKGKK